MKHEMRQRTIDGEEVWVIATRASNGQKYLFYYAYEEQPEAKVIDNLDGPRKHNIDEATNLAANYVPDVKDGAAYKLCRKTQPTQKGRLIVMR